MAGKNNKKGRGSGGSVAAKGTTAAPKGIAAPVPANTIAQDRGTRYLRRAIRKSPSEARNERMLALTGRISPGLAKAFDRRSGDYYRKGSGNKTQGTGRLNAAGTQAKLTNRESGYTDTYRVASTAGPRPAYAKTNYGVAKRLRKGG